MSYNDYPTEKPRPGYGWEWNGEKWVEVKKGGGYSHIASNNVNVSNSRIGKLIQTVNIIDRKDGE